MVPDGKTRRLQRLIDTDGKTLLIAIDHAMTNGRLGRVSDASRLLSSVVAGGADGIVAHRGAARQLVPVQRTTSLVIHLSGNTSLSDDGDLKTCVCHPESALTYGADAVSAQMTLGGGSREDRQALSDLGQVVDRCNQLGLPLIIMVQVRASRQHFGGAVLHAARVAMELGADIVKVASPGKDLLAELVTNTTVPVVLAGGEPTSTWSEFLLHTKVAIQSGIAGVCVGRRIFEHLDQERATAELRSIVHC